MSPTTGLTSDQVKEFNRYQREVLKIQPSSTPTTVESNIYQPYANAAEYRAAHPKYGNAIKYQSAGIARPSKYTYVNTYKHV